MKEILKDKESYKTKETRNFHDEILGGSWWYDADLSFDQDEFDKIAKELIEDFSLTFILDTAVEFHEVNCEIGQYSDGRCDAIYGSF